MSTEEYLGPRLFRHLVGYSRLKWPVVPTNAPVPRKGHRLIQDPDDDYSDHLVCECGDRVCNEPHVICSCGNLDCQDVGKHPVYKRDTFAPTFDFERLRDKLIGSKRWIGVTPNIQLAPGPEGGFSVLDVDGRHGGDKTLAALVKRYGPLPRTPCVSNGPGQPIKHYYLKHDERLINCELGPGLEIITAGKLIVAPPSLHWTGMILTWVVKPLEPLAAWPEWIFEQLARTPASERREPAIEWFERGPPSAFAVAVEKYNSDHREYWDAYGRTCPICRHRGCFGPLNGDPEALKWKCFSSNHPSPTTGGTADIHAHAAGVSVDEYLRKRGYLKEPPPRRKPKRGSKRVTDDVSWLDT